MAVSISTKFYQDSAWKDVSKIVFTSPNMTSPNTVGTRSHILPGDQDLGLWYEDTSNMYRIESSQTTTTADYYNFISSTVDAVNLSSPGATVTVTGTTTSYQVFHEYIKSSVGCTAVDYTALNMSNVVQETRVKLEYSTGATASGAMGVLGNVYSTVVATPGNVTTEVYELSVDFDGGDTHNQAWVVDVIGGTPECYIDVDLDKPYKITKIYMQGEYAYDLSDTDYHHKRFFGNFKIYGKLGINDDWVEMYDGANTSAVEHTAFLTSNDDYYRYYRIMIEDNTGLTGANTSYYALSALQFYTFEYNDIPTRNKAMYSFNTNGDADIVYVSDISTVVSGYALDIASTTGSGILAPGTVLKGWGVLSPIDYDVNDSIVFEVTTGEAYNCRLTAWDDVTHSTTANELITNNHVRVSALAYCASNSKLDPQENYDPINYVWGPVKNRILKGNSSSGGTNYYYGDFDLVYRFQDGVYGDYLLFKPMLYGIHSGITYGVHDYVITLHYSYT